ncbi:tetratricopeptide repeat protein [Bernardetia sp.]|uniref:tetratricopeptide repeat protein n=1 Tax=Bernardetia sp. TaxID=1937974 RepID=UPI0025C0E1CC|nr:tetratricopeptide repeat protein [Bernardetia sp.]
MNVNYPIFLSFLILFLFSKNSFAQTQIDSLQRELQNTTTDTTKVNLYNELAFEMCLRNIDSALLYADKGLQLAQKIDFKRGVFTNYENTGIVYSEKADVDKAMEYFLKAIKYKEQHLPKSSIVEVYRQIGILFFRQQEFKESERYLKEAIEIAQNENSNGLYKVYFTLATLYSKTKQFDEAETYFEKCLEEPNLQPNDRGSIYLNTGNLYQRMENLDKAETAYQKALEITPKENQKNIGKIYNGLTDVALKTGKYNLAEIYANKGLEHAKATQNIRSSIYAHRNLSYALYLSEDYKNAFEVLEKYRKLRDSLIEMTNAEVLNELEQKYQNEKKQNEIERLQQEQFLFKEREKATKTRNILVLIIAIITTAVLLLLLQLQRTRHKRDISLKEIEKQVQELELREKQQQIEQYKERLERHTNNLLQKNLILSELREELSTLKESQEEEDRLKRQKIEELIGSRILTEEDWQNYKQTFLRVHPHFFEELEKQSPKVSKAEKRIATLLKLGLSQYEMAAILGISEESVRKGKYRLRQRLEVDSEEEMMEILSKIN